MSGGSQTIEVKTYQDSEKLGVIIQHPSTCKQAKAAIAEKLQLKPQSLPLFGLFVGPLGSPSKVLRNSDHVPLGADFSFHRWSFDLKLEAKLCRQDDVATHLLYCEATHVFLHTTRLKPSQEEREELESYMDPDFPVERQFMELVRTVPGYDMYVVDECTVKEDILSNRGTIQKGTQILCHLDMEMLSFVSADRQTLLEWNWKTVRRWKMDKVNTIMFEVCIEELNAPMVRWVTLESRQINYLFHLASDICDQIKIIQDKLDNPVPPVNPALAGKVQNPLAEFVNGIFYGFPQKKFSSIPN